jgi:hypothetical protein
MRSTKLDLTCICFKKFKLTHPCFKSSLSICSNWIDREFFFHFRPSKIRVSPTGIVSSLSPRRGCIFFGRCCHTAAPCHTSFPWSQDELVASASSSGNASFHRLSSRVETEALNLHHHHRPASLDRLTFTLHYYKKVISTLATLSITQPCLHFASSLARAPHDRSSTCHHRYLSLSAHAQHRFAQWHPWWWTSWPSFTSCWRRRFHRC